MNVMSSYCLPDGNNRQSQMLSSRSPRGSISGKAERCLELGAALSLSFWLSRMQLTLTWSQDKALEGLDQVQRVGDLEADLWLETACQRHNVRKDCCRSWALAALSPRSRSRPTVIRIRMEKGGVCAERSETILPPGWAVGDTVAFEAP
jgi:hypothetical protein